MSEQYFVVLPTVLTGNIIEDNPIVFSKLQDKQINYNFSQTQQYIVFSFPYF